MSGLAFQKLNGNGTAAYDQLLKLVELVQKVEELNFPDIYKMARMFAPDMELIPVTKTWHKERAFSNEEIYFDGVYFGQFTLSHNSYVVGNSDNNYKRSVCNLWHVDDIKLQSFIGFHGDDILPLHGKISQFVGYGTSCSIGSPWEESCEHEFVLSFIGFKLEDLPQYHLLVTNNSTVDIKLTYIYGEVVLASGEHIGPMVPLGSNVAIEPVNEGDLIFIDGANYSKENPFLKVVNSDLSLSVLNAQIYSVKFFGGAEVAFADSNHLSLQIINTDQNFLPSLRTFFVSAGNSMTSIYRIFKNDIELFYVPPSGEDLSPYNGYDATALVSSGYLPISSNVANDIVSIHKIMRSDYTFTFGEVVFQTPEASQFQFDLLHLINHLNTEVPPTVDVNSPWEFGFDPTDFELATNYTVLNSADGFGLRFLFNFPVADFVPPVESVTITTPDLVEWEADHISSDETIKQFWVSIPRFHDLYQGAVLKLRCHNPAP